MLVLPTNMVVPHPGANKFNIQLLCRDKATPVHPSLAPVGLCIVDVGVASMIQM